MRVLWDERALHRGSRKVYCSDNTMYVEARGSGGGGGLSGVLSYSGDCLPQGCNIDVVIGGLNIIVRKEMLLPTSVHLLIQGNKHSHTFW